MNTMPGMEKPDLIALPQIKDRMTFLYLERCKINRQDGAITVTVLEPGEIDHFESARNDQSRLIRNSQCTSMTN